MRPLVPTFRAKFYRLLRWSERYVQIDMVYLFKNGFWLSMGQILSTICSFFLAIIFARYVPKDIYGTYKFILSLAAIIGAFSLNGMGVAVIRAIARKADGTLAVGFWLTMKWGIITFLIGAGCAIYYFAHGNSTFGISLIIASISMPLTQSFSLYSSFFTGRRQFKINTYYGIISTIGSTAAIIIAIFLHAQTVGLVVTYFISNLLFDIVFYVRAYELIENEVVDRLAVTYSKHISFMNIFAVAGDQFDNIIIFHTLGPIPLSLYSYAVALPDQIIGVFKNILSLVLPRFSQMSPEEIRRGFTRKMIVLSLTLACATIVYIILAPYFYTFFFPAYTGSIGLSRLYAIVILLTASALPATAFDANLVYKTKYFFSIAPNILRITLMVVLIVPYGIWGIVTAQIITKTVFTILGTVVVLRGKMK